MNSAALEDFPFFPIQLNPENGRHSLYMSAPFPTRVDGGLLIEENDPLTVDGVMTSLYDRELHPFVGGKRLSLQVGVQGACRLILVHRTAGGEDVEHASRTSTRMPHPKRYKLPDSQDQTLRIEFELMKSEQSFGRWYFRIEPIREDVKLLRADWVVHDVSLEPIIPALVICTFKRERQVVNNVEKLTELLGPERPPARLRSASVIARLGLSNPASNTRQAVPGQPPVKALITDFCIFVVDNAGTLSRDMFSSSSVRLIRQRNVGGAGGFGRGIHEALEQRRFSHIVLLDDDADVDGLSILRMMNLLRLSSDPRLFVGGLQFDVYSPRKLADAGAYWMPERFERPVERLGPIDVGTSEGKDGLARAHQSNFNGWWLFGGRVESFETYGMPLPCFVHLDDVEFGLRVQLNGGRTVSVPGIAVWHEPFYAKVEGWFAYYNIRNELIRLSAQAPLVLAQTLKRSASVEKRSKQRVIAVSKQLRTRFRDFVNTYQYGSASLLAKAIEDFLHGPDLLRSTDAEAIHKVVMASFSSANANYRLVEELPIGLLAERPYRRGKLYRLAQIYSRNGNRAPIPGNKNNRVTLFPSRQEISWKATPARQAWAYPDPASSSYHLYQHSGTIYAEVDARFRRAIRAFNRQAGNAQAEWADAYSDLTSRSFWSSLVQTF